MEPEYWINRWVEGKTGFHRAGVNPLLERYWPQVASGEPARTLVPLCGKSEDLRWLAERGHDVVGVDLSDVAARAFAAEQEIAFAETHEPPFTVFRHERITYYAGDFFGLTAAIAGRFELVYDRAALIALPPKMRPQYARHVISLLEGRRQGLLISLDYDTSKMEGPPFGVSESEVRDLFGDLEVSKLYEHDCLEEEPRFKERGLGWLKEAVYRVGRES